MGKHTRDSIGRSAVQAFEMACKAPNKLLNERLAASMCAVIATHHQMQHVSVRFLIIRPKSYMPTSLHIGLVMFEGEKNNHYQVNASTRSTLPSTLLIAPTILTLSTIIIPHSITMKFQKKINILKITKGGPLLFSEFSKGGSIAFFRFFQRGDHCFFQNFFSKTQGGVLPYFKGFRRNVRREGK
jgi:hypothetical protein